MDTLKYWTFFFFTAFLSFTACTSDGGGATEKAITTERLAGDWELAEAVRDGQKTASLEGTYMRFSGENQLSCNFTGEEVNDKFTIAENEIVQGDQSYKVESLTDSELIVSTDLMDFDFKLIFNKAQK